MTPRRINSTISPATCGRGTSAAASPPPATPALLARHVVWRVIASRPKVGAAISPNPQSKIVNSKCHLPAAHPACPP